jgi:hypothetical protein
VGEPQPSGAARVGDRGQHCAAVRDEPVPERDRGERGRIAYPRGGQPGAGALADGPFDAGVGAHLVEQDNRQVAAASACP